MQVLHSLASCAKNGKKKKSKSVQPSTEFKCRYFFGIAEYVFFVKRLYIVFFFIKIKTLAETEYYRYFFNVVKYRYISVLPNKTVTEKN